MGAAEAMGDAARTVLARCDALGAVSEEPDRLTRRYGTPPMRRVNELVGEWMRAAGMATRRDQIGNVIGRYEGVVGARRTLLLGSHLDTVRDAGKYDGPLGVLVALAAVEHLHTRGARLPFAIEVIGFADEEGLRFHSAYLGSRALAGTLGAADLGLADAEGMTLAEAIRDFDGDPEALADDRRARADLLGYCEVHIEQGPVLEARGLPLGIVSAIQGQSRAEVAFAGMAGHAGTVPMELRHDALAAAAEFIAAVEAHARITVGMVATVGQIAVEPGASNVIPGRCRLSLDVRHPEDATRAAAWAELRARAEVIAARRGMELAWRELLGQPAVRCDPRLTGLLARAMEDLGEPVVSLPSGAGHDAAIMADLAPMAMLFVRCAGGISHHPAEAVSSADAAAALAALAGFLGLLAVEEGGAA
jgi:allantoate deiminase